MKSKNKIPGQSTKRAKKPISALNGFVSLSLALGAVISCSSAPKSARQPASTITQSSDDTPTELTQSGTFSTESDFGTENSNQTLPSNNQKKAFPSLELRLLELEAKVSGLNGKLELAKRSLEQLSQRLDPQIIEPSRHPADISMGAAPQNMKLAPNDPDLGFVHDSHTGLFRKSMILFLGHQYPEAVLSFSEFIEEAPDHSLSGSAQFYIGQSYLAQKEYKLAVQEHQLLLERYPQSAHVSDALASLAKAQLALGQLNKSEYYRERLTREYPASPAAANVQSLLETRQISAK